MEILINEQIEKGKWNEFVKKHKNSNPFHLFEFYESFNNNKLYYPIAIACIDEITKKYNGILLALVHKENNFFLQLLSRRSIVVGGPLVDNTIDSLEFLIKAYNKQIKKKAIYSQFRNLNLIDDLSISIFNKYGYFYIDHLNIILEIPSNEDQFLQQISRSRRKGIKKAGLNNFTFQEENYRLISNEFYFLLIELYKRIKLPIPPKQYFDNLYEKMENIVKVFSLKLDGQRIIIIFTLSHKDTLYGHYIAIKQNKDLFNLKPVDFFYFKLFCWCINNNFKYFDWMGAGKPDKEYGVRKFKQEYGGETLNLGRFEKVHNKFLFYIGKIGLYILKKI